MSVSVCACVCACVCPRTMTSPLSFHSLAAQPSLQQPAPVQVTWPREQRRSNLTDIHTPTLFRSSWRLLAALDTTPKSSSTTPRKTQTTHPLAIRDTGQPSRASSTAPSPNSNSQPQLRDTPLRSSVSSDILSRCLRFVCLSVCVSFEVSLRMAGVEQLYQVK